MTRILLFIHGILHLYRLLGALVSNCLYLSTEVSCWGFVCRCSSNQRQLPLNLVTLPLPHMVRLLLQLSNRPNSSSRWPGPSKPQSRVLNRLMHNKVCMAGRLLVWHRYLPVVGQQMLQLVSTVVSMELSMLLPHRVPANR